MKKSLLVPIIALTALSFLAGAARAQVPAKPAIAGTWIGTAVVGGGEQIEITVVLAESAAGCTGKISDASGIVPETELRQIVLKEDKLSFELDLDTGSGPTVIKIELTVDGGTMKGAWSDPGGDSGAIELALKK